MKNKTILVVEFIILIIIALIPGPKLAEGTAETVLGSNEMIINTPIFSGKSYFVQTDGLGGYQAVNETDSSIISSSPNVSYIINSLISDNSRILFDTGTFVLTDTITSTADNVTLEGQKGTVLQIGNSANINAITLSKVKGWKIQNLYFDGNGLNQNPHGIAPVPASGGDQIISVINATNTKNININNCTIINSDYTSIVFRHSSQATVTNNHIFNSINGFCIALWNTSYSIVKNNIANLSYYSAITISDLSNYNTIEGNIPSRAGQMGSLGDGIEIGSTPKSGGTVGNIVVNNTCHDNVIDGISIAQSNLTVVSNNIIFNNYVQGISVESNCTGTLVMGNYIYNNSATTPHGAGGIIVMGVATSETTISSNRIFRNFQNGILLYQSTNSNLIGNIIFDNGQKNANVYDGISVSSSNNTISNNKIYDGQPIKTQRYGINELGGYSNNTFVG